MTKVTVRYKTTDFGAELQRKLKLLMVVSGNELRNMLIKQSRVRPDGIGGEDGAVYSGHLSGSIQILETTSEKVVVGTNVNYAPILAEGRPSPDAKLEFIKKWMERKKVDADPISLTQKLRDIGPMPNPFHNRAAQDFEKAFPSIVDKVRPL